MLSVQVVPGASHSFARRPNRWSPEIDLLLACARWRLETEHIARVHAAAQQGVDWALLLRLGRAHRLLPLLHRHASSGHVPVPPEPLGILREQALANTRRSLQYAAALMRLLRLCADHEIPAVPLKGPVLAQQVYGSTALRQVGDLDILLREGDLPRLVGLMDERGYRVDSVDAPQGSQRLVHRDSHHLSAMDPGAVIRIELHQYLLRPRGRARWNFDYLAPRLRNDRFMGLPITVLPPEELFVYLCEHGAEHTWSRLEWLVVLAELLRRGEVRDWNRVASWAKQLGATHRVDAAFHLANDLLGAPRPTGAGRAGSLRAANRLVLNRLRHDPGRTRESPGERLRYLVLTDPTTSARIRRCWTTLLRPSLADEQALDLPKILSPLYGVVRPVRLLARQVKEAVARPAEHTRL
jgi:hypothetical protein